MCGRYTLFSDDADLVTLFDIDVLEGEHESAYNQAPSEWVRSVVGDKTRVLTLQKWGFKPMWAKENFRPLINARSETLVEKNIFRPAAMRRRCLLPANGYYEWVTGEDGKKQPFFLAGPNTQGGPLPYSESPVLAMAGIYDWAKTKEGEEVPTCAIVTRSAADNLGHIHPRMPLFIPPSLYSDWLDPELEDPDTVDELIRAVPVPHLAAQEVSRAVGNVRVNDPDIIFG